MTPFQSPKVLIQCGFIWKETMHLVSRKEFNACQVSLLWHNSFLVSLWTLQPTLVHLHYQLTSYLFKIFFQEMKNLKWLSLRSSCARSPSSTTCDWMLHHDWPWRGTSRTLSWPERGFLGSEGRRLGAVGPSIGPSETPQSKTVQLD